MYEITITIYSDDNSRETVSDYATTKHDVARIIARETSAKVGDLLTEINAKDDSSIYRDNDGWRAEVRYTKYVTAVPVVTEQEAAPAAPVFTITTDWLGEFDEPATIEDVREVVTNLDSGNDSGWRYWLDTVFGDELRVYAEPIDPDTDERPFGCQHSIEVTPELHYLVIGQRATEVAG